MHPLHPTRFDPRKTGYGYLQYDTKNKLWHPGVDYNWGSKPYDDLQQPVWAPADAEVTYVAKPGTNGGLGNYVLLYHKKYGVWTRYAHLHSVRVTPGTKLDRGETFSTLGGTGGFSPHLHFEVLNQKGIDHIRDHWRQPFNGYFAGLSREEVASMTLDPIAWVENAEPEKDWRDEVKAWAEETGVITSGWESPTLPMSQERVAAALMKLHTLIKG